MVRNDDPEYVRSLERALEAAELEIKGLEGELREQDKMLQQLHDQLSPTHMGEPLIARPKVGADSTADDLSKCPQCGGEADNGQDRCYPPTAYLCSKCSEWHNAQVTGSPALTMGNRNER